MSEIYTPTIDWMIFFEDTEHDSMVFTDEDSARKAYEMKAQNWNCHLFYRVSSESGIDYPKAEIQQLQTKLAESEARVGRLLSVITPDVIDLVRCGIGGNYGGEPYHEALKQHRDPLIEVLNETPAQSLAAHDAEVVDKYHQALSAFMIENYHAIYGVMSGVHEFNKRYKLRQQQTNGE